MTEAAKVAQRGLTKPVAEAVLQVTGAVGRLGKSDQNNYDNYSFASIDTFIAAVSPLTAEAGLVIIQNEIGHVITPDPDNRLPWLTTTYEFVLVDKSGSASQPIQRSVTLRLTGPQSAGSAQSYALKQFMRSIFLIPTGESDGDDIEQEKPTASSRGSGQSNRASGPRGGARKSSRPPTPKMEDSAATPNHSDAEMEAARSIMDGMSKQIGLDRLEKFSRDNAPAYNKLPQDLRKQVYDHYAKLREQHRAHVNDQESSNE